MLAHIRKTIAEFFVFVDFHLYFTKPDGPHGGLFVWKPLEGGGLCEEGGLLESLGYIEKCCRNETEG